MVRNIFKTYHIFSVLILFMFHSIPGQVSYTPTIMAYNILNYAGDNSSDNAREDDLRNVIHYVSPDILMAVEVRNTTGYNKFLSDVLNYNDSNLYEGAVFTNQSTTDMDIALYFKPEQFEFVSTGIIDITSKWGYRDAVEFVIKHIATGKEIRLYGVHLKAGNDSANEAERESQANILRDYLNTLDSATSFLVMGDFNFYKSSEGGFKRLTESQSDNDGQLIDPINMIGYWHNSAYYANVHTQSTRGDYNGQWYGGLDDRFDFILASNSVIMDTDLNYVNNSYISFGNDGEHFNKAINDGSNSAVPDSMADALVAASDHLPVYMELEYKSVQTYSSRIVINEIMQNPKVTSDTYGEWFEIFNADSVVIDIRDWTIKDNGNDSHVITSVEPLNIYPGEFAVLARNSVFLLNEDIEAIYDYSGFILSNSEDEIILLDTAGVEIDRVEYSSSLGFQLKEGASMALNQINSDNNVGSNWSLSTALYGAGNNLGTPGEANYDVAVDNEPPLPVSFKLYQNYPNPFNPVTTISFDLPEAGDVKLVIYDILGREVDRLIDGFYPSGYHTTIWNASNVSSGIYLYQLTINEKSAKSFRRRVNKLVVLK